MKVCVFGAGGRTGVEVVKYAMSVGYSVTAVVYDDNAKEYLPADVEIIQGDVLNYHDVERAVRGAGAVISVVGHIKGSDPLMQTKGMTNIVRAMNEAGVVRVLSLTGTGVRIDGDTPSVLDQILNVAVRLIDPKRVKDGIEHARVLQHSDLEWTVVRVLKLSKSELPITDYVLTEGGPAEQLTSRKKVAHVLVDLLEDQKFICKMPVVSG